MLCRMLTSVAVLSDVHGVLPVLEAVLAEPDVQAADRIVVTGDLAAGPQPTETLQALRDLGERAVLVRGNADRELVALARGEAIEPPDEISPWAADQLSDADVALLDGLSHPVIIDVAGFGPIVFCHGSPRHDEEVLLVDTRLERWAEAFADLPTECATVVCGHTHMPFMRLVDRRLVINPGSIGMPYGRPGAAGCSCAAGRHRCDILTSTSTASWLGSPPTLPTRTRPHGPTTSYGRAPAMPTHWSPLLPVTAGSSLHRRT